MSNPDCTCELRDPLPGIMHRPSCDLFRHPQQALPTHEAMQEQATRTTERGVSFVIDVIGRADADIAPTRTVEDILREREGHPPYAYCPGHDAHHIMDSDQCKAYGKPPEHAEDGSYRLPRYDDAGKVLGWKLCPPGSPDYVPPAVVDLGINPKDIVGATKAPLGLLPWTALVRVAKVFALGAKKYGPYNWRTAGKPVQHMTYCEAALRHIAAYIDGETLDPESGESHLAHAATGLLILLDAQAVGNSIDNRPTSGLASELMALKP